MLNDEYRKKRNKYSWVDNSLDDWCKKQATELRHAGIKSDTAGVTRLLMHRVIIPNRIELKDLVRTKLIIRKRKWR